MRWSLGTSLLPCHLLLVFLLPLLHGEIIVAPSGVTWSDSMESCHAQSMSNDNYCDCLDGSDERNTSACSHLSGGRFACSSNGVDVITIPTSRVNDGTSEVFVTVVMVAMRGGLPSPSIALTLALTHSFNSASTLWTITRTFKQAYVHVLPFFRGGNFDKTKSARPINKW
eukprot:scaffold1881_cov181-Ochromonas_danica.AAC.3